MSLTILYAKKINISNIFHFLELNDLFKFLLIYNKYVQKSIVEYLNILFKIYHNFSFHCNQLFLKNNIKELGKLFFFKMNYLLNNSNLVHKNYIDIYTYLYYLKNNTINNSIIDYIINNIHYIIHNSFELCKRQKDPIKYSKNIVKIFKFIFIHRTLKNFYISKILPILNSYLLSFSSTLN